MITTCFYRKRARLPASPENSCSTRRGCSTTGIRISCKFQLCVDCRMLGDAARMLQCSHATLDALRTSTEGSYEPLDAKDGVRIGRGRKTRTPNEGRTFPI